jgi:hypothetical protein
MSKGLALPTAASCVFSLAGSSAFGQEVWVSPNGPSRHYTELLQSSAGWPGSAKSVKTFKISTQFAILANDADFGDLIEGTKRLHFKLALEGLMLTSTDRCGQHIEGYAGPAAILRAAQRIRKYGATLSYIAMDSVLIFGHESAGPNACRDSIDSLARQVAEKIAQAKSVFPDVQVGDIEPIGNPRPGWLKDIADWTKAYQAATGAPLAFLDFDVDWSNPHWAEELESGVRLMDSLHIPIGITYNGSKREASSREWVTEAVEHFRSVEGGIGIHPAFAVIQSWNQYPERMIPETDPETLSHVVLEYSRVQLEAGAAGQRAQQVWFAPNDNLARGPNRDRYLNRDFPHLFDSSPAWEANTDVFVISPMMGSTVGPADQLDRINGFLAERHIALAVGIGAAQVDNANPVPGECGFGVEGMARPNRNAITFKRLKSLGIDIRYVFMDEPLTFAHFYQKKNACRYSLEDTARRVGASIAEIRQYYPDVKVADAEAPNITSPQEWNAEFPQWLAAYRRWTGQSLDAVVFDIDWRLRWKDWVSPSVMAAHRAGQGPGCSLPEPPVGGPPTRSPSRPTSKMLSPLSGRAWRSIWSLSPIGRPTPIAICRNPIRRH